MPLLAPQMLLKKEPLAPEMRTGLGPVCGWHRACRSSSIHHRCSSVLVARLVQENNTRRFSKPPCGVFAPFLFVKGLVEVGDNSPESPSVPLRSCLDSLACPPLAIIVDQDSIKPWPSDIRSQAHPCREANRLVATGQVSFLAPF